MTPYEAYVIVQLAKQEEDRLHALRITEANIRYDEQAAIAHVLLPVLLLAVIQLVLIVVRHAPKQIADGVKIAIVIGLLPLFFFASHGFHWDIMGLINVALIGFATCLPRYTSDLDFLYVIPVMAGLFGFSEMMIRMGAQC